MFRALKYGDMSNIGGDMKAYAEKTSPYIDESGEAVITPVIKAIVKGLIQRCIQNNLSPIGVLYHTFMSIGDPKHIMDLRYLNTEVDLTQIRKPKTLEFEQAVRYLGLPLCIEHLRYGDFISCDHAAPTAAPIGVHYAIMCKPDTLNGFPSNPNEYVRMEFIVHWTDELKTYLSDMENRYYAYKDGEDSGWRL